MSICSLLCSGPVVRGGKAVLYFCESMTSRRPSVRASDGRAESDMAFDFAPMDANNHYYEPLDAFTRHGFDLVRTLHHARHDGVNRVATAAQWKTLSDHDLQCAGLFIQASKR